MSSQLPSLPLIRTIILMMASLSICRADPKAAETLLVPQENPSETAIQHTDWRAVLRTEFKYTPSAPPDPSVSWVPMAGIATNPDVVVMPKYIVRETAPDYGKLDKAMRFQGRGVDKVSQRLGIGRHEVEFGHFSIGVKTIFFIPVALGINW